MKKSLLILTTLFISLIGYSQAVGDTFTEDFITYEVTSVMPNEVETTGYNSAGGTVVDIPATTTNNLTTYAVTAVGFNSFNGKGLTAVTFPNNIISIGQQSFANNSITSITFPNSVISIGSSAFYVNNLTHVTIPSGVTDIGFAAFRSNPLATVTSQATIPPTIYVPGINDSFYNRAAIDLTIPSGTSAAYASGGWTGFQSVTEATPLAIADTFIVGFITYEVTSVSPDTVEAIDYDFSGGTIVNIPATVPFSVTTYDVTSIGNMAFMGSIVNGDQLTSVTIPNSILSLGENSFNGNSLTDIIIPDSVTSIGGQAFAYNDLVNANIGNNVVDIASSAFRNNQLTSIIIPDSVTSIGANAFGNNPLNAIIALATTPTTVITGTNDSFANDRSNINLILTGNSTNEYVTDSGALWTGFKMVFEATSATTAKVTDYEAANGTSVTIPASITVPNVTVFDVTEIGSSAFYDKGLTDVIIPEGVTTIGTSAFEINNLTSVSIPDSVTAIGLTAFSTNSITNLSLGINVESIGIGAFVDNNLTDITIPSNITSIGLLAFGNNPLLANVTSLAMIPPTITTGANDTFIFDRSNTALHIPAGTLAAYVTDIGALWTGFNPVTEDAVLSISEAELTNDVKVVTTTDAIKIIASNNIKLENYALYTITGHKVATGIESEIPINYLASGIYVLKLDFKNGTVVKKVAVN
ncbi:leucine-rich repeat domain-containing protein [Winogradskyella helgolandensis]|uniref:leucine-rich repeat domain-containing protein n=1 Tax=Winogradskyella helgolandensis TaxID=2697010 RepID=UPI0015C877B5|nr:leucine-rich repeat domain-containing protein [Winogradskyella helgolandensis]